MKRKAFTLVELLVVISIIALLVSILMPALGKARSQAKKVWCLANIRGIMIANVTYTMGYDDKLPFSDEIPHGRYPYFGLLNHPALLIGEGLTLNNLHCPADRAKAGAGSVQAWFDAASWSLTEDYFLSIPSQYVSASGEVNIDWSYNWWLKMYSDINNDTGDILPASVTGYKAKQWKMTHVKHPSQLIALSCFNKNINKDVGERMVHGLTGDGHQAGFLDGHVEWVDIDDIAERSPIGLSYGGNYNLDWTKNGIKGIDVW